MKRQGALLRKTTGFAVATVAFVGCAAVLPTHLEDTLASSGSADDHRAAAMLYQTKAQQLETVAVRYETQVSTIRLHEDPKGFRRGALKIAGQENRNAAKQMQELYAAHVEKAQTLYGKKIPE